MHIDETIKPVKCKAKKIRKVKADAFDVISNVIFDFDEGEGVEYLQGVIEMAEAIIQKIKEEKSL